MTRELRIHPEALAEGESAVAWYRAHSLRAAERFMRALELSIEQIVTNPSRYPYLAFGARRLVMNRFPYILVYRFTDKTIDLIAIAHGRRRPFYWRDRL